MVMYNNEFETRDKISEDKIEPHHTYSICGDTEGAMCPVKRVEFRENERAFFPLGQTKLSVITRCLYKAGVRKAGFDFSLFQDSCSHIPHFHP